jgi:D-alanyl-lipoteichoic acid acyltransferase DltB (MBOAT superfamily)
MLFTSFTFALFFTLVWTFQRLPLPWTARKAFFLVASYGFYAAWKWPYLSLLLASTAADWFLGRALARQASPLRRRLLLSASLVFNLGLLSAFKYSGFLFENLSRLLGPLGLEFSVEPLSEVLPVGISFYTFQTLSYTIDIYRGRLEPARSVLDYALYVAFFPQLVAGPIVRAADFLPQLAEPKRPSDPSLGHGLALITLGLFQKSVLADGVMAPVAEAVFDGGTVNAATAWVGALAFAGQIYCDFAGYSTIALGAAACLGFRLPENFRAPYAAIGFSDFWRRWHISLSSWMRDYLYIPLGGNRRGEWRGHINRVLTMLLAGLWHGANWTYVAWGGLHGLWLVLERLARRALGRGLMWSRPAARALLLLGTLAVVCWTWVFFRAKTLPRALEMAGAMLGGGEILGAGEPEPRDALAVLIATAALLGCQWLLRGRSLAEWVERAPAALRALLLAGMIFMLCAMPGRDRAFLYFQF